jgi:hypothetical protein
MNDRKHTKFVFLSVITIGWSFFMTKAAGGGVCHLILMVDFDI